MKKAISSNKLTFDLTDESKATLEELKNRTSIPYGRLINRLINVVCNMPSHVHDTLQHALELEYARSMEDLDSSKKKDAYYKRESKKESECISDLLMFMNLRPFDPDESGKQKMKKISLADGYLVIPEDWIVTNEEQAQYCHNAVVIECRGDIDAPVPHFIYLFDGKNVNDLSDHQEKDFYAKCIEKWPKFRSVLAESNANQLIRDPDDPLRFLNADEYQKKIKIGIFYIDYAGDHLTGDPPYGAVIVRNKKKK